MPGLDDKERILRQKILLNRKLGLDGPAATGDMDLFDENDLKLTEAPKKTTETTVIIQCLLFCFRDCVYYSVCLLLS